MDVKAEKMGEEAVEGVQINADAVACIQFGEVNGNGQGSAMVWFWYKMIWHHLLQRGNHFNLWQRLTLLAALATFGGWFQAWTRQVGLPGLETGQHHLIKA